MRTDDPLKDFDRWEAKRSAWLGKRPLCEECGEHIQQEDAVYLHGKWYCDDCLSDLRKEVNSDGG